MHTLFKCTFFQIFTMVPRGVHLKRVDCTSIIGQHNHEMQPDIELYAPKYRRLSPEILEVIEFYVTKGNMDSKQILSLLVAQFPDHTIHTRDLYNAIQKFRSPLIQRYGDAQH